MDNPFNDLIKIAQRWADNPTYTKIVALGESIHNGATPDKSDNIINDVLSLFADVERLPHIIPSAHAFFIASTYAYFCDDSLITMTQLAQGLAWARANHTDHFDLSDDLSIPTNAQKVYATNFVQRNGVRIYKDPTQPNPTRANRVLYGDAIEALGDEDE